MTPTPPPPEWTAADLASIDAAIASRAKSVRFADREVTYRSTAELIQARTLILNYLNTQSGSAPVRQSRVFTNKGWSD